MKEAILAVILLSSFPKASALRSQTNRTRLLIGSIEIWPRPLKRSHVTIHGANYAARAPACLRQGRHSRLRTVIDCKVSIVQPFTPNPCGDVNTPTFQIGPFAFKAVTPQILN